MTVEQKIISKLEPHAKRIQDGDGNDFDYLPAVLLQLMEEQKRQANLLDETTKRLDSFKNNAVTIGAQNKTQITAFESAAQRKMENIETAIDDTKTALRNSQSDIDGKISVLARKNDEYATQANEGLSAVALQIKSFANATEKHHVKFTRFLIAGLTAVIVVMGLTIAILLRH